MGHHLVIWLEVFYQRKAGVVHTGCSERVSLSLVPTSDHITLSTGTAGVEVHWLMMLESCQLDFVRLHIDSARSSSPAPPMFIQNPSWKEGQIFLSNQLFRNIFLETSWIYIYIYFTTPRTGCLNLHAMTAMTCIFDHRHSLSPWDRHLQSYFQVLRVPPTWQHQIDLACLSIRSKAYSDQAAGPDLLGCWESHDGKSWKL